MHIYWKYIDKRQAAIAALRDRPYMEFILATTKTQVKEAYDSITETKGINLERTTSSSNPHAGETKIVGMLDKIDLMQERYKEAEEYMEWFVPAWEMLSEDDQYILEEFYGKEHEYGDATVDALAEHFHIERASAYRRKNRAVEKLTMLLYG